MKTAYKRYLNWWRNRSRPDHQLERLAFAFEKKYFSDLTLTNRFIRRRLMHCSVKTEQGVCEMDLGDEDLSMSMWNNWTFRRRRLRSGLEGECDYRRKTISIASGLPAKTQRAALLHEMIHACEHQLRRSSPPIHEWLLLHLHRRLSKQIRPARLQRYIDVSTHTILHDAAHGVFFLLKSLDVDLGVGWELGTVFGYGRPEHFGARANHDTKRD